MNANASSNGNQAQATIPYRAVAGQREAAAERRQSFPYRFPRDGRLLGGKFSVAENARRLRRLFYFERRLMQALGAWTLSIPEFEVKLETGRHIFYHADAARGLRERLSEQELRLKDIDAFRDVEIDRFIEELLCAADAPELLAGIHQVLGRALATAYRHHIDDTDPVADVPTIRCLRRILTDYEPMLDWADAALAAYVEGGVEESRLAAWRWHLQRLLASIGGVTGGDARAGAPAPLRSKTKPFERGTVPLRDVRFDTFRNTGDYDVADGGERFPKDSYEALRLRFIRTQRDEVDAIEAFGTFIWCSPNVWSASAQCGRTWMCLPSRARTLSGSSASNQGGAYSTVQSVTASRSAARPPDPGQSGTTRGPSFASRASNAARTRWRKGRAFVPPLCAAEP